MPSFPPRSNASKKREVLHKKEAALRLAIKRACGSTKLKALAESVRLAQLAVLKAELHWVREPRRGKAVDVERVSAIEGKVLHWTEMSIDAIVAAFADKLSVKSIR